MVLLVQVDLVEKLDQMESPEVLAHQDHLEIEEKLDHQDLRVRLGHLVLPGQEEKLGHLDLGVNQGHQDHLGHVESLDLKDLLDQQDLQDHRVQEERLVQEAKMDLRAPQVPLDLLAHVVKLVKRDQQVHQGNQDLEGLLENVGKMDLQVLLELLTVN